jgi:hypothetical protein
MSDSPTFQSRRERRAAESNLASVVDPAVVASPDNVTNNFFFPEVMQESRPSIVPAEQPQVLRSRRELRDLESLRQSSPEVKAPLFDDHTLTGPISLVSTPDIFLDPITDSNFGSSSNLGTEPVTASIILESVPDLLGGEIVLSGPGVKVTTGSIQIPSIDPTTGSISIILESQQADEALTEDSMNSFVSSVAPVRAAGIAKTRAKVVEMNLVTRKGQGQVYAVMSTAVLMVTVGALTLAAFMLGVFE